MLLFSDMEYLKKRKEIRRFKLLRRKPPSIQTFTVILNSFIPDDTKTMTDLCLKFDDVAKKDIVKKKYTLVSGKTLCSNDHYA